MFDNLESPDSERFFLDLGINIRVFLFGDLMKRSSFFEANQNEIISWTI